jgi:hypothetical protein
VKKEPGFLFTWCSALLDNSLPCGAPLHKREAFRDVLGHYWCSHHKWWGLLLNWASSAKFPDLRFGLYALGPGSEIWELQVLCGKETMIREAIAVIGLEESEEDAA